MLLALFSDLQLSKPEAVEDREGQAGETTQEAGRFWTPIDNFNPQYMEAIAGRQQRVNFIKENRVSGKMAIIVSLL